MPLIKVQTSVAVTDDFDVEGLLKSLSAQLAQGVGKSEGYIQTVFEGNVPMTFGGTTDPTCYVEIKSLGLAGGAKTRAMSEAFCEQLSQSLGVASNRIYIEFSGGEGSMWGWNGQTFG